jgi:hypothetical protein
MRSNFRASARCNERSRSTALHDERMSSAGSGSRKRM